jgi:aminoglycoside 6'-N-acetyltransferase I
MNIRDLTQDDFDSWSRMRDELYSGLDAAHHRREMEWILGSKEHAAFLAVDAGRPAGLVEVSLRNVVDGCIGGPVGYLEGLYLEPDWRGKGLGRELLAHAEAWCRDRGCAHMATDAELDNPEAQAFYERLGFERKWTVVQFLKPLG